MIKRDSSYVQQVSGREIIIEETEDRSCHRADTNNDIIIVVDIEETLGSCYHMRIFEWDIQKEINKDQQIHYENIYVSNIKIKKEEIHNRLLKVKWSDYKGFDDTVLDMRYSWSNSRSSMIIKIDLQDTFNQIWIWKEDEWKIVFRTCYKTFKYNVLLFELINISEIFQR